MTKWTQTPEELEDEFTQAEREAKDDCESLENEILQWEPPDTHRICYYHIPDFTGAPVITVCLIHIRDEFSRGVAIWTPPGLGGLPVRQFRSLQNHYGCAKACGRAARAMVNRQSSDPIDRLCVRQYVFMLAARTEKTCIPTWKSEYMPCLTNYESELLFGPLTTKKKEPTL